MQEYKRNIYIRLNLIKSLRKTLEKVNNYDIHEELSLQEKILTTKDLVIKKSYKSILADVRKKEKDNDEIELLEDDTRESVCPLTKKPIVDKFVSACQHAFEKSAVEKLFKIHKLPKCPVQGCDKRLTFK